VEERITNALVECGKDDLRKPGRQEKARLDSSWFPAFLMVRILNIKEFGWEVM